MRTRDEVSAEKRRGGFYTPDPLVRHCLDQVVRLTGGRSHLRVLEPSAGDGAFIRGLNTHELRNRVACITAVEVIPEEATKISAYASSHDLDVDVVPASVLRWVDDSAEYDVVLGNPPFVRFQFVEPEDRDAAQRVAERAGVSAHGVANLWIPVVLASLGALRPGGVFSLVLPTELLTGISAGTVRTWLLRNTRELKVDLFEPGTFPGVLQQVVVVSGCKALNDDSATPLSFVDHQTCGENAWVHECPTDATWTRYLLPPKLLDVVQKVASSQVFDSLSSIASFEVSIVTGANEFFCVSKQEAEEYDLETWGVPLLERIRHAPGLLLTEGDVESIRATEDKCWLLDFGKDRPDPLEREGARSYIKLGESMSLHSRYKTRIREPWYRVPGIKRGTLLLSKRSHSFPRVLANNASVYTTDTIYRGELLPESRIDESDFVAGFHNSLTLLCAEIEGRSFGGGVLELVPSEINRLLVPTLPGIGSSLHELDALSRSGSEEGLIEQTNRLVVGAACGIAKDVLLACEEARKLLQQRRFSRNGTKEPVALGRVRGRRIR